MTLSNLARPGVRGQTFLTNLHNYMLVRFDIECPELSVVTQVKIKNHTSRGSPTHTSQGAGPSHCSGKRVQQLKKTYQVMFFWILKKHKKNVHIVSQAT